MKVILIYGWRIELKFVLLKSRLSLINLWLKLLRKLLFIKVFLAIPLALLELYREITWKLSLNIMNSKLYLKLIILVCNCYNCF